MNNFKRLANYDRVRRTEFDRIGWFLFNSLPLEIYNAVNNCKAYLCGGALTSAFSGKPIKDFDLFFGDAAAQRYMRTKCAEALGAAAFVSDTAITFKNDEVCVQLCKYPEGTIEDILDKFDFTIAQAGYDFKAHEFVLHEKFLYHLANRRLVYNVDSEFPISSLFRMKRYLQRGFKCAAIDMIKLTLKIHSLHLGDYKELRRQLLGIDVLFLKELTDKLSGKEYLDKQYDFEKFLEFLDAYCVEKFEHIFDTDESLL